MLGLGLVHNIEDVVALLDDLEARQVPFALAASLTQIAGDGRDEVVRTLPERFTLRRDRVARGLRIKPASKRTLEALVFTRNWYMADQQVGAVRRTRSGAARFVPSLNVREGGVFRGEIRRGLRPKQLLRGIDLDAPRPLRRKRKSRGRKAAAKPFLARTRTGKVGLFRRTGTPARAAIERLYTLEDAVTVKPRLGLDETVGGVAAKRFRQVFLERLQRAFETARKRPGRRLFIDRLRRGGPVRISGPVAARLRR